jgi:hypothetical protein
MNSKAAGEGAQGIIRECALSHPVPTKKSKAKGHEEFRAYYISGYATTTSCIMASHHSLHKVTFRFKEKSSSQKKGLQTLAWGENPIWNEKEPPLSMVTGDKPIQTAGGVQTMSFFQA